MGKPPEGKNPDKLTGQDYLDMPVIDLMRHKDYSAHALRVVEAIRKMTTDQLEQLTIARGPQ